MIVAFTIHNRPHYLAQALESWCEVRNVNGVTAVFSCEPGCPEAVKLCRQADFFRRTEVLEQPHHLGVLANPKAALDHAFYVAGADLAVLAEEDMIVSTDILDYFCFAAGCYEADEKVIGVTACQIDPQPGGLAQVRLQDYFQGWCWGTWADRWSGLSCDWDTDYRHNGWDWRLQQYWCEELGYKVAAPAISRVQHIGKEGGTHCTPAMFESLLAREFHQHVPPQDYQA